METKTHREQAGEWALDCADEVSRRCKGMMTVDMYVGLLGLAYSVPATGHPGKFMGTDELRGLMLMQIEYVMEAKAELLASGAETLEEHLLAREIGLDVT